MPTINVGNLVLLGVVSASIHWLLARSYIFEWFWGRLRGFVEKLVTCAACSGFWIGIALGLGGVRPIQDVAWWAQIAGAGFFGLWLTPVFEAVLLWGLSESQVLHFPSPAPPPFIDDPPPGVQPADHNDHAVTRQEVPLPMPPPLPRSQHPTGAAPPPGSNAGPKPPVG